MLNTPPSAFRSGRLRWLRSRRGTVTGGLAPHRAMRSGIVHLAFTSLCTAALLCATARPAAADRDDRGSWFVAVAAVGSAVRVEQAWDTGFGGEVGVGRAGAAGRRAFGLAAASVGGLAYSERSGGRAWGELSLGTRPLGWLLGVGGGPVVELDEIRGPRVGWQATVWVLAGVVPYVRMGGLEEAGAFVDVGVRIAFPAIAW